MKPLRPTRIVGGAVLAEDEPLDLSACSLYRGVDLSMGEPVQVVVREPNPWLRGEDHFEALFEDAVRQRVQLSGSPAPRILGTFGKDGRVLAAVEEHLEGVPLSRLVDQLKEQNRALPLPEALALASDLSALWVVAEAAEPRLHLFVDPDRVLVDPRGRVRVQPVLQVEHARQDVGAAALVATGPISYISPEELRGDSTDLRSPMFTLGLLIYEMLVGEHPAGEARTPFGRLAQLATRGLPPLAFHRPDLPPPVVQFIERCVAFEPERRFESWKALRHGLASVRALLEPVGARQLAAWLPNQAPPGGWGTEAEPLQASSFAGWQRLPRSGYGPLPLPAGSGPVRARRSASPPRLDPELVYAGTDHRPMLRVRPGLLVDARPVTWAEYERYLIKAGIWGPAHWTPPGLTTADEPVALLSVSAARDYAHWMGKRLPTEAEWEAAVSALGADMLGVGEVWEWTETRGPEGHVVRGGRWRDQWDRAPGASHRSVVQSPASDVGFRCVGDESLLR